MQVTKEKAIWYCQCFDSGLNQDFTDFHAVLINLTVTYEVFETL
jgi:hypothetical protein